MQTNLGNLSDLSSWPLGAGIRPLFPLFQRNPEMAYLDSAASSQKPKIVIDRLSEYLSYEHANIHRGAYSLSSNATDNYDQARRIVQRFVGAPSEESVIFVKNSTEGFNLLAYSLEHNFKPGDVVLLSLLEHHSNIVPWHLLAKRRGVRVEFVGIEKDGSLDLKDLKSKINSLSPKLLSITATSNALGTMVPLEQVIELAKGAGTLVALDASQSVMHRKYDLSQLKPDFFVFTGHKIYGPTGIGVVVVNPERFEMMQPFLGGGDMIDSVTVSGATFAEPPRKFEAGTPAIAEAIALGSALEFVEAIGMERIYKHEKEVFDYGVERLRHTKGVTIYGPVSSGKMQAGIISFNVAKVHPHDLATVADDFNVQIRAGHHCAQPLMHALGLTGTARASVALYSQNGDFDRLILAIEKAQKIFG